MQIITINSRTSNINESALAMFAILQLNLHNIATQDMQNVMFHSCLFTENITVETMLLRYWTAKSIFKLINF